MIAGNDMPIISRRIRRAASDSGVTIEIHLSGGQDFEPDSLLIKILGDSKSLISIVEAIYWLSASIRSGRNLPVLSIVQLDHLPARSGAKFVIVNDALSPIEPSLLPSACWVPLVPKYAIAADFRTPARNHAIKSMEMSFELMCLLCGLEYEGRGREWLHSLQSQVYGVSSSTV